jgi:predicted small metal-binding protein
MLPVCGSIGPDCVIYKAAKAADEISASQVAAGPSQRIVV